MPDPLHLSDLRPDPRNARKHTPRNLGTLVDSLHEVGAARSIVIDEHGVILAGNATVEAAGEAGIERVRVIDADGEELIAVRRKGLSTAQKQKLALYDNRAAELADWQPDVLAGMIEELEAAGEALSFQAWRDEERTALADLMAMALGHDPADVSFKEFDGSSFDGVEDEMTEIKFRVPLGDVPVIESQIDRMMEEHKIKDKGKALLQLCLRMAER